MTIEDCLREIRERAALVRYLSSSATINSEIPDAAVLGGMSDVCDDIETLARSVVDALPIDTLARNCRGHRR